jgi:hypothetical protein
MIQHRKAAIIHVNQQEKTDIYQRTVAECFDGFSKKFYMAFLFQIYG